MTGNKEKTKLIGEDLILLGIISIVYPQASQNEMALYIYIVKGAGYTSIH